MNADGFYERTHDRVLLERSPAGESLVGGQLTPAHGLDLSLQPARAASKPARDRSSVSWVRPTELATLLSSTWVGRGIDLQAELVRRSRHAPAMAAAQASRRITHPTTARSEPTASNEGLHL